MFNFDHSLLAIVDLDHKKHLKILDDYAKRMNKDAYDIEENFIDQIHKFKYVKETCVNHNSWIILDFETNKMLVADKRLAQFKRKLSRLLNRYKSEGKMKTFDLFAVNKTDGYNDYRFSDRSKNTESRIWILIEVLSHDNKTILGHHGELQRDSSEGSFDTSFVDLPKKMVAALILARNACGSAEIKRFTQE